MLRLVCDRCGRTADVSDSSLRSGELPKMPEGSILEQTTCKPLTWGKANFKRYDLCKVCVESYETWFAAGRAVLPHNLHSSPDPFESPQEPKK